MNYPFQKLIPTTGESKKCHMSSPFSSKLHQKGTQNVEKYSKSVSRIVGTKENENVTTGEEEEEEECFEYPAITKSIAEVIREAQEQLERENAAKQKLLEDELQRKSDIECAPMAPIYDAENENNAMELKPSAPQMPPPPPRYQKKVSSSPSNISTSTAVQRKAASSASAVPSRTQVTNKKPITATSSPGTSITTTSAGDVSSDEQETFRQRGVSNSNPRASISQMKRGGTEQGFKPSLDQKDSSDEDNFRQSSLFPQASSHSRGRPRIADVRKYSVVNPQIPFELQGLNMSWWQRQTKSVRDLGFCGIALVMISYVIIFFTFPISLFFCIKVVAEYERTVIFRLGRILYGGARGPGLFFVIPCLDMTRTVDLRTVTFDVPPQEVLTKDSVTVAVDAVVYYRIYNPVVAVTNVEDADRSTRLLAATTLRNVLGTKNLAEILAEREAISIIMQSMLDDATDPWGVKVERVEVKDVRLPIQLQRAMAAEAEATREARAKVIAAEGEQQASRALREASDIITQSPFALQLRYLQTLSTISAEKNSTIIFPLPVDLLAKFIHR